jgi:hypothetical protein
MQNVFLNSKIAAFSILILFTISLFVTPQNIEAQQENITAQQNVTQLQNATQPLGPGGFTCTLSPDQPSDPVEMKSEYENRMNPAGPAITTRYIEKEVFECASAVSSIPPPYKADVTISINLFYRALDHLNDGPLFLTHICETSPEGNVNSCKSEQIFPSASNVTNCREDPIEYSPEMAITQFPHNDPQANAISEDAIIVFAQTHTYKCGPVNPDKIKIVTIFTLFPLRPSFLNENLATTCIKDISLAKVESCQAKLVRFEGLQNISSTEDAMAQKLK